MQVRNLVCLLYFFDFLPIYQTSRANSHFQRALASKGLFLALSALFRPYLSLGLIQVIPRRSEINEIEKVTFYYVKLGLLGVVGSNPRLC